VARSLAGEKTILMRAAQAAIERHLF
jgi:hypothetical protein